MANIMITERCNLRCPYCFANEFVNENAAVNMSVENFKKAVEFVLTEKNERIGIIGGEPTTHPQFKDIMQLLIEDYRVDNFTLFTNMINVTDYIPLLLNSKVNILVNCNSPSDLGEAAFKRLTNNLDILIRDNYSKNRITLGINMYKPDFEYEYILYLLQRYEYSHVRTSVCVPNSDTMRSINVIDYFKMMKPQVFRFFRELEKLGVMPSYDCNLMPQCIISQEENEWLKTFWPLEVKSKRYCNVIDCSMCSPVVDILPDLSAVRCFGLSEAHKVDIHKFRSISELRAYFANFFDSFAFNVTSGADCSMCEIRQNGRCMGGCLAFKVDRINKAREFCNLI